MRSRDHRLRDSPASLALRGGVGLHGHSTNGPRRRRDAGLGRHAGAARRSRRCADRFSLLAVRSLDLYDEWIALTPQESGSISSIAGSARSEVALDPEHAELAAVRRTAGRGGRRSGSTPLGRTRYPALAGDRARRPVHPRARLRRRAAAGSPCAARGARRGGASFRRRERDADRARAADALRRDDATATSRRQPWSSPAGAWANAMTCAACGCRRCARSAASCCTSAGRGRAADDDCLGTRMLRRAANRRHDAGGGDGRGGRLRRARDARRACAICSDAACELLPGGWRRDVHRARVGLRPAAADDLPDPRTGPGGSRRSSTLPATTATASCSRRSPRP